MLFHFLSLCLVQGLVLRTMPSNYTGRIPTTHPKLLLNDASYLAQLKALWSATSLPGTSLLLTKVQGAMSSQCTAPLSSSDQYFCKGGLGAASLALAYQLTGQDTYAQKACDTYMPFFDGIYTNVGGNYISDDHWLMAYDWLFNHVCFTDTAKAAFRDKIVGFSDQAFDLEQVPGNTIAHDSDMNINAVLSHFVGGYVIYGEHSNATQLLDRGWTGLVFGLNTAQLPDMPVWQLFGLTAESGIPLVGSEYGTADDMVSAHTLIMVSLDLGILDAHFPQIKKWWPNAVTSYIRLFAPDFSLWKWYSDTQDPTTMPTCPACPWLSFMSMCVYFSEKFGYSSTATYGRYFIDTQFVPRLQYITDGNPLLYFLRSWDSNAAKLDYTLPGQLPPSFVAGFGTGQHTGITSFRTSWSPNSTWGGMFSTGGSIVDHMQTDIGNIWFWRNGEFLISEPRSYTGPTAANIFNSLSMITRETKTTDYNYISGGPIDGGVGFLERGYAASDNSFVYTKLEVTGAYNGNFRWGLKCTDTCWAPTKNASRHLLFDSNGGDFAIVADRFQFSVPPLYVGTRWRTNSQPSAPTLDLSKNLINMPSSGGSYRSLIRTLNTASISLSVIDESTTWPQNDYRLDGTMQGYQVRGDLDVNTLNQDIFTVFHFGDASAATSQLDSASMVASLDSVGGCAGTICLVLGLLVNDGGDLRSLASYSTPSGNQANTLHVVGDLVSGCYQVTIGGSILASDLQPISSASVISFTVPASGQQSVVVTKQPACSVTVSVTNVPPTNSPTTTNIAASATGTSGTSATTGATGTSGGTETSSGSIGTAASSGGTGTSGGTETSGGSGTMGTAASSGGTGTSGTSDHSVDSGNAVHVGLALLLSLA